MLRFKVPFIGSSPPGGHITQFSSHAPASFRVFPPQGVVSLWRWWTARTARSAAWPSARPSPRTATPARPSSARAMEAATRTCTPEVRFFLPSRLPFLRKRHFSHGWKLFNIVLLPCETTAFRTSSPSVPFSIYGRDLKQKVVFSF